MFLSMEYRIHVNNTFWVEQIIERNFWRILPHFFERCLQGKNNTSCIESLEIS